MRVSKLLRVLLTWLDGPRGVDRPPDGRFRSLEVGSGGFPEFKDVDDGR